MHLKRLVASEHFRLPKKIRTFAIAPRAGKHPKHESIPLGHIIRDILGYALSYKEARKAARKGMFLIDGRPAKDIKLPVGLMDVLQVVATGEKYRVVYNENGILDLIKIDANDAKKKLGKIRFKKLAKGGKIQLTLHDGRNFFLDYEEGNKYKVGDSILFEISGQKILDHLPLKEGMLVMIIGGRWRGKTAKVKEIIDIKGLEPNRIVLEGKDGEEIRTLKDYVFVIGKDKPVLKITP
ncbi:MAG: 30S ribosomal protein S4e [Candidatus Nanohaloarchaeota archaeon]|nr:30S ribosomal protein S4e [Candidatus Nanohaloarchaeota archaeon]